MNNKYWFEQKKKISSILPFFEVLELCFDSTMWWNICVNLSNWVKTTDSIEMQIVTKWKIIPAHFDVISGFAHDFIFLHIFQYKSI